LSVTCMSEKLWWRIDLGLGSDDGIFDIKAFYYVDYWANRVQDFVIEVLDEEERAVSRKIEKVLRTRSLMCTPRRKLKTSESLTFCGIIIFKKVFRNSTNTTQALTRYSWGFC